MKRAKRRERDPVVAETRRRFADALARGLSVQEAADAANGAAAQESDMPYNRGTAEHKAYWANRRAGMTRQAAEAAVEAQRAPVAGETTDEATCVPEAGGGAPEPSEAVDIPDGWRELPWPFLRALAAKVSDTPVMNRDDCERAIEAEIERRSI